MWVVRDADSTIYITGTVHILRDNAEWMSPKLNAALEASSELRSGTGRGRGRCVARRWHSRPAARIWRVRWATDLLPAHGRGKHDIGSQLAATGAPAGTLRSVQTINPGSPASCWAAIPFQAVRRVRKRHRQRARALGRGAQHSGQGYGITERQIALSSDSTFDKQLANLRYKLKPSPLQQKIE